MKVYTKMKTGKSNNATTYRPGMFVNNNECLSWNAQNRTKMQSKVK